MVQPVQRFAVLVLRLMGTLKVGCSGSFVIPYHLKDGTYTLQWIWFATGNAPSANSPFQTCMDFKIAGGPTGAQPSCPLWKGGDLSEKSPDACSYVSVNNPSYQGVCKEANACQGTYEVGVPKAIQDCNTGVKPSTYPLEMVSAPNGFPDTLTAYTASGSFNSSAPSSHKPASSTKSPASSAKTASSSAARSPSTKVKAKAKTCQTWSSHARRARQRFRLVRT